MKPSDVKGVSRGSAQDFSLELFQSSNSETTWRTFSCGRRAVGVAQHRVEGAGEVVGQGAAVVLFRQRHQAGQNQQHEEEQVQGEGSPEDPVEEGSMWGRIPPLLPGRQKLKIVTTVYFTAKPELMSS